MFKKFMSNLDTVDSVLEQFQSLRQRLEAIASRQEGRLTEIDLQISSLESEGMAVTEQRDRALKVAKNIGKVFDV